MKKLLLLSICIPILALIGFAPSASMEEKTKRVIYMSAVEPKGGAQVKMEHFPTTPLPEGNGYKLKAPDENGRWEASTYRWEPGLIVAYEGEDVELQIFGVNGAVHHSTIEGYNVDFVVKRGELTVVNFKADKHGIFSFICHDHLPAMQTQLLVLPID